MCSEKVNKIGIILAGSSGSKFWPLSNSKTPEQFINLFGDITPFQSTYALVSKQISTDNIFTVVDKKFEQLVFSQADIKPDNIIIEPLMRQTAPALCLALTALEDHYLDDSLFCVFPSDQLIKNCEEFYQAFDIACHAAQTMDILVTIGVEPSFPTQYFGYIQYYEDSQSPKNINIPSELFSYGLRKSVNFIEKPDVDTAQRFIDSGGFIWNSGILIAKKSVLAKVYEQFMNYHYEKFQQIHRTHNGRNSPEYAIELENLYKTFNKISIDYGILEHADNIYVVKSTFSWFDMYSWSELHKLLNKDALSNVFIGNVFAINTSDSLVISNDKPLAIMGLDDIVAVNTDDAILICKKSESHKVPALVAQLKKHNIRIY